VNVRNDCCTTLDITIVQFQQLFFKLTIESVFLHVGHKYLSCRFYLFCVRRYPILPAVKVRVYVGDLFEQFLV
jgi:hypothetical protein